MPDKIACFIIISLFLSGAALYWNSITPDYRRLPKSTFLLYRSRLKREFTNAETDKMVSEMGLKISGLTYQVFRYLIFVSWLLFLVYKKLYAGHNVSIPALLWILLFLATSPRPTMIGRPSPFGLLLEQIRKKRRIKYNQEIFRCLSQLKNLATAKADASYSSDYIISELSRYTVYTKPIFDRFLGYWYESRYEEAVKYFNDSIGTEDAKSLSNLLSKIDHLKPAEFISQLELYQNEAKERRKTTAQNTWEARSSMVFAVALITSIIILLNFLLISIAIDTVGYFKQIQI